MSLKLGDKTTRDFPLSEWDHGINDYPPKYKQYGDEKIQLVPLVAVVIYDGIEIRINPEYVRAKEEV